MKQRMTKTATFFLAASIMAAINSVAVADDSTSSGIPEFKEVPVPVSDADKRSILASDELTIDGKTHKIGFHTIMRSGEVKGQGTFGLLVDQKGQPIKSNDGSEHISVDNDFSSLLSVGSKLFMVSHFESRPGAMYLTNLNQEQDTGKLTAVSTRNIDFSDFGGLWVPCAGSVTPWNSHLGSEEYPNNARLTEAAQSMDAVEDYDKPMARQQNISPWAGLQSNWPRSCRTCAPPISPMTVPT